MSVIDKSLPFHINEKKMFLLAFTHQEKTINLFTGRVADTIRLRHPNNLPHRYILSDLRALNCERQACQYQNRPNRKD